MLLLTDDYYHFLTSDAYTINYTKQRGRIFFENKITLRSMQFDK